MVVVSHPPLSLPLSHLFPAPHPQQLRSHPHPSALVTLPEWPPCPDSLCPWAGPFPTLGFSFPNPCKKKEARLQDLL